MSETGIFNQEQFLSGGGEMGELIRSMDWSKTALGSVENWPQSLRTSVSLCLASTFPILIAWGPETIQIYNDAYRPICGAMHPQSMGMNFRICWASALEVVGDKFTRGQHGEGTYIKDQRMFLERYGYLEEAFMTFSFAPIRDESGGVGGIFHPITETTDKMLSARRTQVLRDLGAAIGKAKTIIEIGTQTEEKYPEFLNDLPFVLLYQYDEQNHTAVLLNAAGLEEGPQLRISQINLAQAESTDWPFAAALADGKALVTDDLAIRVGTFSCAPYPETPHTALILPIHISGQEQPFGFLVAGVSSRRALDEEYLAFYDLLGNTYNTAVSNVYAYEQEQKRAEALAEIDRSKTAFFSNVSHEFRTPLTLMLGPLEDLLTNQQLSPDIKVPVEATHRNALRLLKLVNNLLDYSRVEAGRAQAAYEQLNLSELTADLASSFRSIIEKAGMELMVNCQALNDAVYVDRQMWEKIVLNLLSNAFKYTLAGQISISLEQEYRQVILRVSDTGIGIPEKELPHMFERFHRVENAAGRTHEGTGIGLSLVHELVHLHHGEISVESIEGQGSTFTVVIPTGKAHLPQEHLLITAKTIDSTALKGAFIQEAFSLLQDNRQTTPAMVTGDLSTHRDLTVNKETSILIVDDNADMRAYLTRLLEPFFTIVTAVNGSEALDSIRKRQPDLVLSDMMMPVMDGKAMLQHIRSDESTTRLPVIFLSARAGEEARIDGLDAGADDYLVKPFSAAELLTKVRAQINIAKARGLAETQLRSLLTEAPVAIASYRGREHRIELVNERMLQYWGRSAEQIKGKLLFDVIPELESQGFREIMDQVYETGERFITGEVPVQLSRNSQTETVYMNLTIEPLRNADGKVNGMMAVASDITEQVLARQQLEKVSDTLSLAIEASRMGIWKTTWGSDLLEVSPRARIIHGIPQDEVLSFDAILRVVVPEHRDRFHQAVLKVIANKGSFDEDYQIQPFDGSKRKWLNSCGKVELNEQGEVISVIGTILDITESKEDELRKNDFIGMVSHELKTPLTSMNGFTQMLSIHASKNGDLFAKERLDKISVQAKRMTTLINGFLNVSRLESGKISLQKSTFEFNSLIREVISDAESASGAHRFFFQPADEILLHADRDKIGSVLSNLVSNAIKYSAKGTTVFIAASIKLGELNVSVRDEGMGIQPYDLEKLFDRYYRVVNADTQYIAGFGIGLYLSAEIIERHGGRIWAESKPGVGSTFCFSLPMC